MICLNLTTLMMLTFQAVRCLDYCWKSYCHNNFRKFEQPPVMSTTFDPMTVPLSPPPIVLPPRPSSSPSRATSSTTTTESSSTTRWNTSGSNLSMKLPESPIFLTTLLSQEHPPSSSSPSTLTWW